MSAALLVAVLLAVPAALAVGGARIDSQSASRSTRYEDLLSLFSEWRAFQAPKLVAGVPDYSVATMAAQHRELPKYQQRLAAIDSSAWPVSQQVDWHLVRAEMNGMDFDHRVLRPWAKNPAFYVTVFASQSDQPSREGPWAAGAVEVWSYTYPLAGRQLEEVQSRIRAIPGLLEQAKKNLVGNTRDLWAMAPGSFEQQSATLADLARRIGAAPTGTAPTGTASTGTAPAALQADVQRAKEATDAFAAWVAAEAKRKTGPSGVGVEHYDWYAKNVQLVPYTWRDQVTLIERELARSHAFLALEEQRNAKLPAQVPIASEQEHVKRFNDAVSEYLAFLKEREILTIRPYMEPALRSRVGRFRPGPREFFGEVNARDPLVMRTHDYHWIDLARMANEPHPNPIRRAPLLYNIFNSRTEGHATGWEEILLQAGLFDARPRARELVYVILAERAARALGDLRMHANELSLEQASELASRHTPRGWLSLEGELVRAEQHLYLQQPAYGTSYVTGKFQFEELLSAKKQQLGDRFVMKTFMDEFDAAGLIPMALLRWELTGKLPPDVARMLAPGN